MEPEKAEYHYRLSRALYGQGRLSECREVLLRAYQLTPSADYLLHLGLLAVERGERSEARAVEFAAIAPPSVRGLIVGSRVFDPLSGLEGRVTGAGLSDRLLREDVRVELANGASVIRPAAELIARPAIAGADR